jgi:outer membrane immunogenic protein
MNKKVLVLSMLSLTSYGAMAQSAFEGFYGQVGVGYEKVSPSTSLSLSIPSVQASAFNFATTVNSANSYIGVVTLGYNQKITNEFLLGIGAEYEPIAGSKGTFTSTNSALASNVSGTYQKKNSYNFFVSPGYVIDKDKLAYAKVGYAGSKIFSEGDTTDLKGYSFGLGYKQTIQAGLYGYVEGNYFKFNDTTTTTTSTISGRAATTTQATGADAYNFIVGVGYKF